VSVRLPAEGRHGDPPEFPLLRPSKRELELWARAWKRPQAVAWEAMGCEDVVARYVRVLIAAEKRSATGSVLMEVRRFEDALGLSPVAMLRLRWTIDDGPAAPDPELRAGILDIRDRIEAVE
jgi:hypothetical protein